MHPKMSVTLKVKFFLIRQAHFLSLLLHFKSYSNNFKKRIFDYPFFRMLKKQQKKKKKVHADFYQVGFILILYGENNGN